jgi:tRNA (guanine37-N1)-methyltransferase
MRINNVRKRLQTKLSAVLSPAKRKDIYNSFDIVGNIAIVKLSAANLKNAEIVANQIMEIHKSVKTVFAQLSPIKGDFRIRQLRFLAGENITTTVHKESGCLFKVDIEKCYFSPRLYNERARIASMVKHCETIVNMFAGVGCFSLIIAKSTSQTKVYSIDVNPTAVHYMQENVRLNRMYNKVFPMLGDSKDIIKANLQGVADRVLMPLPEKSLEYLPYALLALKKSGGWLHFYDFQHATSVENPIEKTKLRVTEKLHSLNVGCTVASSRIVRSTGPYWWQTVLDIGVSC